MEKYMRKKILMRNGKHITCYSPNSKITIDAEHLEDLKLITRGNDDKIYFEFVDQNGEKKKTKTVLDLPKELSTLKELSIYADDDETLNNLGTGIAEKRKYISNIFEQYMDVTSMIIESKMSFYLTESHEFINPYVKVEMDSVKGIKVVATKRIFFGEIICKSKAFAAIQAKTNLFSPFPKEKINLNLNALVKENLEKASPEKKKEFFSLYNGANLLLNAEERTQVYQADLEAKINCVIKYNSKSSLFCLSDHYQVARGIWTFPAYFNHSCEPNVYYFGIGDYLILLPARDIMAGEEITLSYVDYLADSETKRKILKSIYGFDCKCPKCEAELNKINQSEKYKELREIFINFQKKIHSAINNGENLNIGFIFQVNQFLKQNEDEFTSNDIGRLRLLLVKYFMKREDLLNARDFAKMVMDGFHGKKDSYLNSIHLLYINALTMKFGEGCTFAKTFFMNFEELGELIFEEFKENKGILV
ncbi:MAG: SET domain-containing protein [archaeon]|nr:SET domain-containing protein [archaeon]